MKFWNGLEVRGKGTIYVAANSRAQASRIMTLAYGGRVGMWVGELKNYFHDCWPARLEDFTQRPGVWFAPKDGHEMERVWPRP